MKDRVMDELKKSFRPEFLNRIDEVIVFHSLSREDVKEIVDLLMRRVREQLKAKDVDIELTDAAKELLAEQGLRPGPRAPGRCAGRSSAWSRTRCRRSSCGRSSGPGQTIIVDARDGEIVFERRRSPPDTPPVEMAGQQEG